MKEKIAKHLMEQFSPVYFEISDESHFHKGHRGVKKAENTHFKILVVSNNFLDKNLVQRQREINKACQIYFDQGLHALAIRTYTIEEWRQKNG